MLIATSIPACRAYSPRGTLNRSSRRTTLQEVVRRTWPQFRISKTCRSQRSARPRLAFIPGATPAITTRDTMAIEALFHPRAVAVIGASTNPDKIGGMALRLLKDCGFEGEIYPINPTARDVQGLRAFASLTALPDTPDAAIVAVP